jgi:hypothetical protein
LAYLGFTDPMKPMVVFKRPVDGEIDALGVLMPVIGASPDRNESQQACYSRLYLKAREIICRTKAPVMKKGKKKSESKEQKPSNTEPPAQEVASEAPAEIPTAAPPPPPPESPPAQDPAGGCPVCGKSLKPGQAYCSTVCLFASKKPKQ